jgi:hypothetical protein
VRVAPIARAQYVIAESPPVVQCGEFGRGISPHVKTNPIHVLNGRHGRNFIDDLLRIAFAAALQVRVDQEVHRMELVTFPAHVHRGCLSSRSDRRHVGIDVVLPQSKAGENVRRHMQCMRRRRRDLRVPPRGWQAELC